MNENFRKELLKKFQKRESGKLNMNENKGKEVLKQNKNSINSKIVNPTVNSLNKNVNNNNYLKKSSGKVSNYYTNAPSNNMSKAQNKENLIGKKSNNSINIAKNNINNNKKSTPSSTSTNNKVSFSNKILNNFSKAKQNDNAIHTNTNNQKNERKRTKSLRYKNNKNAYSLNEKINKNFNKSKSIVNKNKKMDINNFISKKDEIQVKTYEELDDIIKINDVTSQSKRGNDISNSGRIRTETDPQITAKEQPHSIKRLSVMNDNRLISKKKFTKDDFEVITLSGRGAYGTVLQVYLKKDPSKKIYAIKKLDIHSLFSVNRLYQAYLENQILNELDSPFIVKTLGAFEEDGKIHIVMDYLPNGDFSHFIKTNYPLNDDVIKYYSAQIVLFLEYMQKMKLIHRDLKPQNIMIDEKGNLKVIDFGTVRKVGYYYDKREMKFKEEKVLERIDSEDIKGVKNIVNPDEEDADDDDFEEEDMEDDENDGKEKKPKVRNKRIMTFVGTAEYISPEVIADKPAEYGTDIWAFGIMLYEMYYNRTPFKAATAYLTFRNIEKPQLKFPDDSIIPDIAKDLIMKILIVDPKKRLGGGDPGTPYDIKNLKKHPFFKKIKWDKLQNSSPPGINNYKFNEPKKNKNNEIQNERYSIEYSAKDLKINNNAKIIREGMLKKKSAWLHYEKRYIILDTTPRLLSKNPNNPGCIKEIPLNKKCKINIVENNCFDLKTPSKTYRFKGTINDGNDWAGDISDVINVYGKDV